MTWTDYARRAAADRLALRRPLDPGFVRDLEVEAVMTCRQTGRDWQAALDELHTGLWEATRSPVERPTPPAASDATSPAWLKPADGLTALARHLHRRAS